METLKFISLASGSSGNCYYLGTGTDGILVDAGIGIRRLRQGLSAQGIVPEELRAILVTHDHIDHIKAVGCMSEQFHIPVYATAAVHTGMANCRFMEPVPSEAQRVIEKEAPFTLNGAGGAQDFRVTAFEVPHDSSDNVGYHIQYGRHRITFATDVGHITETVAHYLCMAEHIVLEANYDEAMLLTGPYPHYLKERVKSPIGHLSNREAAEFLAEHYHAGMQNIWLCHLSETNNRPDFALKTVESHLAAKCISVGKDVNLMALKYASPSALFEFTD